MIIGKNIVKRFGDQVIFDGLDFQIRDGEFVCFAGESGAGKTTLLNIIGLLEPIDSGELLINGKTYSGSKAKREYYKNEVGFLFQNFALIENKTVKQNLELVRSDASVNISVMDSLRRVGLEDKINSKVYTLSGGEQQRVAAARLIRKQCNIILADEPTGSLDRKNAEQIMDQLFQMNSEGKTVILVTHDEKIRSQIPRIIELHRSTVNYNHTVTGK